MDAQYNLMQMIAAAVIHRKKSPHPVFSPVIRKAFNTQQHTWVLLYTETTFIKLRKR